MKRKSGNSVGPSGMNPERSAEQENGPAADTELALEERTAEKEPLMPTANIITFVNPASDPRLSPVALPPADPSDPLDPPPASLRAPEPSVGRLHWGDFDPITDSQMERLDAIEALNRLVERYGTSDVYRWLKFVSMNRGVILPDHRS